MAISQSPTTANTQQKRLPLLAFIPVVFRFLVIGIPILFILVNVFLYFFLYRYDAQSKTQEFAIIDLLEEPVDVLILGDSVTNSGINPKVIEEMTGLKAINLSMNARWTFYHDVWITEYYIEKFGPPKYIIWGKVYDQAHRTFDAVDMLSDVSYPLDLILQSDYLEPNVDDSQTVTIIMNRLLPLISRETTIETIADKATAGKPILTDLSRVSQRKGFSGKDFVNPDYVEDHADDVQYFDRTLSDDNQRVVDIFLDLIEEHNIPTYTFITPVHESIGESDRFQDSILPLRQFWHDKSLENPMLHFNPEVPVFDAEYMYNSDHLNIDGANIYTAYLADWIWGDYSPATFEEVIANDYEAKRAS